MSAFAMFVNACLCYVDGSCICSNSVCGIGDRMPPYGTPVLYCHYVDILFINEV